MTERLELLRTIGNRLVKALAILVAGFIPGAIWAYWHPGSVLISTPLVAFVCGVFGGFVGLQRRLKTLPDDDLTLLAHSWVYVCLSPLVGGILAMVTYILFVSELLAGDLFPKFVPDTGVAPEQTESLAVIFAIHGEAADYGKLMFWCFVAGFSERFATNIIGRFESDAAPDPKPPA
jgi:hypothetical protein